MFDVQSLMDMQINEANSTSSVPVPENEYQAQIKELRARPWSSKDGLSSGVSLDVSWEIIDADGSVKEVTGRDKNIVRQSIGLDFKEGTNDLDFGRGRNVGLGRLREAVGLNEPGRSFSFPQLVGQIALVRVKHRSADDGTDTVYAEVKAVTKVG